jgi:hypothetical protein
LLIVSPLKGHGYRASGLTTVAFPASVNRSFCEPCLGAFYRLSGRINPPRANVLTRPHFASLHKLKLLFEARLLLFAPSDEAISR